jgi:hypothetical protein
LSAASVRTLKIFVWKAEKESFPGKAKTPAMVEPVGGKFPNSEVVRRGEEWVGSCGELHTHPTKHFYGRRAGFCVERGDSLSPQPTPMYVD